MALINLTGQTEIKFDIYASRTGSNIKVGIHDSGGTTTETTPNVTSANTWQTVSWDISGVSDANKDAIDSIIITIVNADADNTFYIDNMFSIAAHKKAFTGSVNVTITPTRKAQYKRDFAAAINLAATLAKLKWADYKKSLSVIIDTTGLQIRKVVYKRGFTLPIDPTGIFNRQADYHREFTTPIDITGLFSKTLNLKRTFVGSIDSTSLLAPTLYLGTATTGFLNLQSGLARPHWEVNYTVSGAASTTSGILGKSYDPANHIISMGSIDREKPVSISGLSRIVAGDITLGLDNKDMLYSPNATASIFTDGVGSAKDYFHSTINIWAGFENTGGVPFLLQRGSFLLTKLRIDSERRLAYLTCEDAAKIPLQQYLGLPDLSGTAVPWLPPSGSTTRSIMTEMLSGVGLTASQYSLESGIDHSTYTVENERVSDALGKLAQRSRGFVYTNGKGQIVFTEAIPTGGLGSTSKLTLKDTDRICRMRYSVDVKNLVNKVQVNYLSGAAASRASEDATVTKGRPQLITNDSIDLASIANAMTSRLLGQYSIDRPFIEIDNIWLPSLEIGDKISVWDTNTYQTAIAYEIYRIREDITKCQSKIYGISDIILGKKWGYCSDTSAVNCGTVFTNSWHSGFAFACYDTVTSVNPAFDLEGNNNNVINTAYAASGAGTTGIELPFNCQ